MVTIGEFIGFCLIAFLVGVIIGFIIGKNSNPPRPRFVYSVLD